MPHSSDTIAYCHSCGNPMDVTTVAPFSNVTCPSCGKHTRVKREFGPYTLTRRHALGGMSMVFVAQDNTLGREVALKILSEEFSADERRIKAFEEEARITASFSHPHVVRVLRTGRAFGRFYIAMELVPGGHFEHQIKERGKIPEAEMLPLAIEVAQGLKAAHAAGLIHRDVKPGNILLDADGHAKLVDFGLALVTQGGKAQATELWATPYYVPPETIEGDSEDFRSDIYAFGATLYHALAGRPSCGEETMATDVLRKAKQNVIPLSEAAPDISADTCTIIERAMAYDPKDRFSSYDDLISQLENAMVRLKSGGPSAAEVSQSVSRRRARKKGDLIILSAAGVMLFAALGGGIWWITRKEPEKIVKKPAVLETLPIIPAAGSASATDIAKIYREAREAVASRHFEKASREFAKLGEDPNVQEPTRTWAGVEAVVAAFLDGKSAKAQVLAKSGLEHASGVSGEGVRIGDGLIHLLGELGKLPAIPAKSLDSSGHDASHVMAWMLAGLKDWEQGMLDEAGACFSAVAATNLSQDEQWLNVYQELAKDYLADQRILSSPVFEKFPADKAGCEAAVAELNTLLPTLKTRGRARYNIRAWQLDLARHAKLLGSPKVQPLNEVAHVAPATDLSSVMARLSGFAGEGRFREAAEYLKTLPADPEGATRESLLFIVESSGMFLTNLETDLAKGSISAELPMKSGEVAQKVSIDAAGKISTTDAAGKTVQHSWSDFSADALIALHRIFVKNPRSESDRLSHHQCAIAFDWLAGNRERALSAAALLSQSSATFKQQWETIASGLPK
ncbi:MAG: serine/threonine-protein kinase [Luteolibacter sp.]